MKTKGNNSEYPVEVGQLYIVTTGSFWTSGKNNKFKRSVLLKKGEVIEIRYPYEWHFRTEDNHYFHVNPQVLEKNAVLFGTIWENVRFANRCELEDILKLGLYKKEKGWIPDSERCKNEN